MTGSEHLLLPFVDRSSGPSYPEDPGWVRDRPQGFGLVPFVTIDNPKKGDPPRGPEC